MGIKEARYRIHQKAMRAKKAMEDSKGKDSKAKYHYCYLTLDDIEHLITEKCFKGKRSRKKDILAVYHELEQELKRKLLWENGSRTPFYVRALTASCIKIIEDECPELLEKNE